MALLSVGSVQSHSTIVATVVAAQNDDPIEVDTGIYTKH